jgi:menaquinone-specific isochorismate synthase
LEPRTVRETPVVEWGEGSLTGEEWRAAVATAISRISTGELDKVVLARDVVGTANRPVDTGALLARLAADYPNCWTFSVDGLVGATPELLVRRVGDQVTSRVLAGTVKRRGEESVDAGLAAALLGSGKDLEEHEYAVHSVAAALAAHCTDLEVPERPHILRLANVQHLATDVTGRLADAAPVLALAASLHPTAAVCGTPTERALAVIRELEGMDRGRYAGPVGWFDSRGDGEFGIALRCAEIEGDKVRAFAGCGLVAGSDPESEWAESQAKLVPMRTALSAD